MTKYILKKDLPFAKAGDEVFKRQTFIVPDPFNNGQVLFIGELEEETRLISEGWICEVKPREFIVELYGKDFQLSRIVEIKNRPNDDQYYKYIKVREVIE